MAISLSSQGATPLNSLSQASKSISSALAPLTQKSSTLSMSYGTPTMGSMATQKPVVQGTNPGMIKSTVSPQGTTTNYDTKPNPSVLEQQKALNKLGAGLVEDGIIGDKTRAAIAKYGTGSSSSSSAVKAPDDPSNKYNTATGQPNPNYRDPNASITSGMLSNSPLNAPTISTNPAEQAQNVSNAGGQSQNEYDTQARLIELGKQASPEYIAAQEEAKRVSDNAVKLAEDYSQKTNNIAGTAGFLTQQTGLQGLLNNQYNTVQNSLSNQYAGATNRLGAANTQQGLLNQAAGAAYSGAQTQAGRGLSAQSGILNASLPGQQGTSSQLYNPLEGVQGGNSVVSGANRQSAFDLTQQKNEIQSIFNGAEANFKLLVDTAKQGGVNDTNQPIINQLKQRLGVAFESDPAVINFRSTLAAVRSQYANILGGGSATDMSRGIAAEQIPDTISLGALQSLEQQMKSEATNRIVGIDNQVKTLTKSGTQSSSQSSGNSIWDF